MTDQLRDQIAALFPSKVFMAHRDNIAAAVVEVVAPLLAERDSEIADLDARRARWALEHEKRRDEIADLRVKHQRLIGDLADTRGKLGEAQGNHWAARERLAAVEASRRDWATESMRLDAEVEKLRDHIADCHRFQTNVAAVVEVDTDWDEAGRRAVVDAVCRMSGNLADARRAVEGGDTPC